MKNDLQTHAAAGESQKAPTPFLGNKPNGKCQILELQMMSDQSFDDEWLRNKNVAFRQALDRQDFSFIAEYAIMFAALFADHARDKENASWELAQTFENTSLTLKPLGRLAEADAFYSRAEAIRQNLDRDELERMLTAPQVIPDVYGPTNTPFESVMKDLVTAIWQASGMPRQQMAWQVIVNQPWRLLASWNQFVFWLFDLESLSKDEKGRTGREHFMQAARNPFVQVQPHPDGKTVREQVIDRGVIRIQVRQADESAAKSMLAGYYLSKLVGPIPK